MKHEISWNQSLIRKQERHDKNGHKSLVVWLTGLSGSGKSTLARSIERDLFIQGIQTYVVDGDNLRYSLNQNLGFSTADRQENIRRIGEVAKLFVDAGIVIIVSAISPFRKDRQAVRKQFEPREFVEVFVKCPLEECEKRDPKGLYKKVRAGQILEFTGVTQPYEEPITPELIIETHKLSVQQSLVKIKNHVMPYILPIDHEKNETE